MLLALALCSFKGGPVPSTLVELFAPSVSHIYPVQWLCLIFILTNSIWHIGPGVEGMNQRRLVFLFSLVCWHLAVKCTPILSPGMLHAGRREEICWKLKEEYLIKKLLVKINQMNK